MLIDFFSLFGTRVSLMKTLSLGREAELEFGEI